MNALPRVFLTGCLLLTITAFCPAQDKTPPVRKVSVIGTCIIKVVPDEMLWSIQVSIDDVTLAKAKARHDASLGDVLKYLKSLGDDLKDLQTGGISFEKYTGDDKDARRHPYNCSTQITFTLTDFDKYGPICDMLAKFDGTEVQSVGYDTSKEAELRRDALKRALLDAHDKAQDLATTAGCTIDKPLSIEEQDAYAVYPGSMNTMNTEDTTPSGTPTAVAGQIDITAKVVASYDLTP